MCSVIYFSSFFSGGGGGGYNKKLNDWPLGKQRVLFPSTLDVPRRRFLVNNFALIPRTFSGNRLNSCLLMPNIPENLTVISPSSPTVYLSEVVSSRTHHIRALSCSLRCRTYGQPVQRLLRMVQNSPQTQGSYTRQD